MNGWKLHQRRQTDVECPHDEPCDCGPITIAEMCDYDEEDWPCEVVRAYHDGLKDFAAKLPGKVAGIDYTSEGIEDIRQQLSGFREEAMNQWPEGIRVTVVLTHAIVLLSYLKDLVEASVSTNRN